MHELLHPLVMHFLRILPADAVNVTASNNSIILLLRTTTPTRDFTYPAPAEDERSFSKQIISPESLLPALPHRVIPETVTSKQGE